MAHPIRRGVALAALAALLFGVTAPLIKRASADAGAFGSAAFLYLGAGLVSALGLLLRRRSSEARLTRRAAPRLVAVTGLGAVLAPAALVLGLRGTDGASGALLLALEAPLTVLLAWVLWRERVGRRALAAVLLILAGSLVVAGAPSPGGSVWGAALVGAATLCWALDNTLSRGLADLDPIAVVAGKGLLGASVSAAIAVATGAAWPSPLSALVIAAAGAGGYGLSLQLYLRAQRVIGAGRTASVFASGPFFGVLAALLLGSPWPGLAFAGALVLVAAGLWAHAGEKHGHAHRHQAIEHEHAHVHDDGHHDHDHAGSVQGPHSHPHRHEPLEHTHEHSEDSHHLHSH